MKAFADVSAEDAKCMARYTARSFQRHQPRFICSNAFDGSIEPHLTGGTLDLPKFMELLSPCFPPNSNVEDVKAVLKRSNVVIFGNHQVLLRVADSKGLDLPAKVVHYVDGVKDLLSPDVKPRFSAYKDGKPWERPEEDVEWSINFIRASFDEVAAKEAASGFVTRISHNVFEDSRPVATEYKPLLK
eukprot:2426145-Amphidinium_carterae.1